MMRDQLLYMWIRETNYECFKESGFNFSPEYEFSFSMDNNSLSVKSTNKLNIYSNNPIMDKSNVCNVSAIVGNNGAGKTTALKKIIEMWKLKYYEKSINFRDHGSIYVYIRNNALIIVNNTAFNNLHLSDSIVKLFPNNRFVNLNQNKGVFNSLRIDSTVVYISLERKDTVSFGGLMSSNFIPLTPKQIENVRNVFARRKTPKLIKTPLRNRFFNFENFLFGYLYSNFENVLFSNNKLYFALALVDRSSQSYTYRSINSYDLYSYPSFLEIHQDDTLWIALFKMLIRELLPLINRDKKDRVVDSILHVFKYNKNISKYDVVQIKNLLLEAIPDNNELSLYFDIATYEIEKACDILENYSFIDLFNGIKLMKPVELSKLYDLVLNKEQRYSFLFKYMCVIVDGSDGELAYLRHLAYLVFASNPKINPYYKEKSINKSVLILLDEADIHLHPEWQRQLLSNIIKSINEIFYDKNVQIILTTHSPIILSDIPSQNIIYINNKNNERVVFKNYEKNTFGANIYDLYNDSFFFDDSVIMGDYAKNYINNLYDKVDKSGTNNFEQFIELIGDENIKNAFNKINTNEEKNLEAGLEDQITEIKNNIKYLQDILIELEREKIHDKD